MKKPPYSETQQIRSYEMGIIFRSVKAGLSF